MLDNDNDCQREILALGERDKPDQFVGLVCRETVETEAAGFLALPEEVFEEVVQHVAVAVELQETLCVLRLCGGTLG